MRYYSTKALAEMLGVHFATVRQWVKYGHAHQTVIDVGTCVYRVFSEEEAARLKEWRAGKCK